MSSQLDLKSRWDILSETARIATTLRQNVEDTITLPIHPPPNSELSIPEFSLPIPHELLAEISALEIPEQLRESIFQSFYTHILQLQQEYISSYKRTCFETSRTGSAFGQDFKAINEVYKASSEKFYIPMVKTHASFILAEITKYQQKVAYEEKRPFNAEYTPVLEKYFEYNAYPSALHQSILAEKSMMTRRQIEVWFQNHRNRAKKDSKTLRRNTSDLPLRLALILLRARGSSPMARLPSPSEEDSTSEDMEEEHVPQPASCIDSFVSFRPQHAFPTSYPPSGSDPFPTDNGVFRFPPPIWSRLPVSSGTELKDSPSIDVDDLARMFHVKLNILEGGQKRAASKTSKNRSPWFAATVTIPSRAPHPASLRALSHRPSTILPMSSSTFSFQSPMSSRSTFITDAFLCRQDVAKSRKILPLPRRVPAAFSHTVPSSPSSPSSRTSSFSSEYSSRSRSSSSSSCNRTPEPSTPPHPPTLDISAIKDADHAQQSPDEIGFSALFGDDSDVFRTSSGSLGIPQSVNFAADKRPPTYPFTSSSQMTFPARGYIQGRS